MKQLVVLDVKIHFYISIIQIGVSYKSNIPVAAIDSSNVATLAFFVTKIFINGGGTGPPNPWQRRCIPIYKAVNKVI